MAKPAPMTETLINVLRRRGPLSARDLGEALGVSQPTISRLLDTSGAEVTRFGRARRTRYAARRDVRGLGHEWPLFRVDAQGRPHEFGLLAALHGGGCLLTGATPVWLRDEFVDGLFPGVPWFLDDQRPQGFLGRQFAQRWSRELGLPADVLLWDNDAVLTALLRHGEDGPGNFILGEAALERALQSEFDVVAEETRWSRYGDMANVAIAGEAVGSSAAGEQPKFTATVIDAEGATRHVIVKFTEPVEAGATAQRWADLLICEHLAGQLLAEQGNASAPTELIWSQGRLCLEATRFDRIGAYGRRGCVSLAAWSDAHDGNRDDWVTAARRMHEAGWIDDASLAQVRQRWWFGRLIGNTDMHFGNLSFFFDDTLPMAVTPSYDMLPMLYRPASNGAIPPRVFQPAVPSPGDMTYWLCAARWAVIYWTRVSQHAEISEGFHDIAKANIEAIARLRERFDT